MGRRVENLLLIPGMLAAEHDRYRWQAMANELPPDAVLIVVPMESGSQREILEHVARSFEAKGQQVTMVVAPSRLALSVQEDDLAHSLPLYAPTQLTFDLIAD